MPLGGDTTTLAEPAQTEPHAAYIESAGSLAVFSKLPFTKFVGIPLNVNGFLE